MARDDVYMMTPQELRLRRRKRIRLIILGVLVIAIGVGGYFGGRPASHAIKGWQARRQAQKAFELIEQEKWNDARAAAIAAYQLRPTEPEALRAVARFLSRTRQPQALEFWSRLAEVSVLSPGDKRDEAAAALLAGDITRADRVVGELTAATTTPADWLLAAQLALQKGVAADLHAALAKVFEDPATSDREKFQAVMLELGNADVTQATAGAAEHRKHAVAELRALSFTQSSTGLAALVVLAQQALARQANAEPEGGRSIGEISRALEAHPLAAAPQKLLALDLLVYEDPARRAELIERAITEWKDGDPPALAALAAWLNGKQEYQRQLETIPLERALQTRDLFLQHLDALGALGRWTSIKDLLEAERFPIDEVVQRMYLARCNAQLGQKAAADNNWQRAIEAAAGDATKLMTLAQYAEKNAVPDVALIAYEAALGGAPQLRAAHQGRLRVAQTMRDTRRIHAALADMLKVWPNDPAVQNDEAYTRLLLSTPNNAEVAENATTAQKLAAIEQLATSLVEGNPASLPHRTLLALARLKQDRAADALAVYDNIQVAANALTPSALAVHAAVLAANGQSADAVAEARQIPADRLLPEERALIANLL